MSKKNVFLLIANPLMLRAWHGKLMWQIIIVKERLSQEQHPCFVHCVTQLVSVARTLAPVCDMTFLKEWWLPGTAPARCGKRGRTSCSNFSQLQQTPLAECTGVTSISSHTVHSPLFHLSPHHSPHCQQFPGGPGSWDQSCYCSEHDLRFSLKSRVSVGGRPEQVGGERWQEDRGTHTTGAEAKRPVLSTGILLLWPLLPTSSPFGALFSLCGQEFFPQHVSIKLGCL